MNLQQLLNQKDTYDKVKNGDLEILATMSSLEKIKCGLNLQNEFGEPPVEEKEDTVEQAFLRLVQRQKDNEEFAKKNREEHFRKLAEQQAQRMIAGQQIIDNHYY